MITIKSYEEKQVVRVYHGDRAELYPSISAAYKDKVYTTTRKITIRYKKNKDVSIYIGKPKRTVKRKEEDVPEEDDQC